MKIYRCTTRFHLTAPRVLMIGNFDGVHRGHQKMISCLQEMAAPQKLVLTAMSFYPHPRQLTRQQAPQFLSTIHDRAYFLEKYGIEDWILVPFTPSFMQLAAEDFVQTYLFNQLDLRALLVGDDFRFGYRGAGNVDLLRKMSKNALKIAAMATVADEQARISSSRIRQALLQHRLDEATHLLGHALTFTGLVRAGAARGRKMGVPTANIHVSPYWCLPDGVYVVKLRRCKAPQQWHWAVANLGTAPTFSGQQRKWEVHLLPDSHGVSQAFHLYGCRVQIAVMQFLRTEKKFENMQALSDQIHQDIAAAQSVIAAQTP